MSKQKRKTATDAWMERVAVLADQMQRGGVRKLLIERTPHGTYRFEIDPVEDNGINLPPAKPVP